MFKAKYDNPLDVFISNNPEFTRTDLENHLESLGIYTGKTPRRSINRDVLKYLRKNSAEFEKLTTKEVRATKDEIITDDDFARDDFIDRITEDEILDSGIWYKKILKTGKTTNPRWKTSTNIEAITFEKNDIVRFDDMLKAIQNQIPEISYIDEAGYDQNSTTEFMVDEEAQYPRIRVNLTSGGTTSSEFVIAD